MNYVIENLSAEELKFLKKEIYSAYITGTILGTMASFLFGILMFVRNSELTWKDYCFILLIISLAIFISSLTVRNLHLDILKGVKHLYKFTVTKKLSFLDNEPGLGGEKMKYYLISDERRFLVSEQEYNNAQINDFVVEHLSPASGLSLKIVVFAV